MKYPNAWEDLREWVIGVDQYGETLEPDDVLDKMDRLEEIWE